MLVASALWSVLGGCAGGNAQGGLDVRRLPVEVRADYAVFARRCSKCHPLERALNSGIQDDAHWVDYVRRMRRQPGSGITADDVPPILRFLHYHSLTVRAAREDAGASASNEDPS